MARYIDADKIHQFVNENFKDDVPYEWAWTLTAIDHQPTADVVEVKHGEWTYNEIFGIEFPECSVCGTQFEDANCGDYPYCPECGAKMDGGAK